MSRSSSRRLVSWGLAAGLCLCAVGTLPGAAQAQEIDDKSRGAARALANQAADAFEKGEYERAADLFHRAYVLMPVPSLSIYEARALEKAGKIFSAIEAYQRTARSKIEADSPPQFRRAVEDARAAIPRLKPRLPYLRIVVSGPGHDDPALRVTLNGKPIQSVLIGVDQPVNPGDHQVEASTPSGDKATGSTTLAEGEKQVLELKMTAGPKQPQEAAPIAGDDPAAGDEAPVTDRSADTGSDWQTTWGFVGLGVGAAGLGVGVITGLMAVGKHSDAEAACGGMTCPEGSAGADDAESFRTLRTVSTIGYVVGVIGAGAGLTLLLTAPSEPEGNDTAQISAYVGPGTLGVTGRF